MKNVLIVFIIMAILLTGCAEPTIKEDTSGWVTAIRYKIIYIENMPCLKAYRAITCDWSKWEGK